MKSRVSFCNGALLRRSLSRTALIWVAYLLLWLIMLPGTLLSSGSHMDAMALRQLVLQRTTLAHGMSFFYGVMVAWFLFAYLCRGRSANFFAALPLRRETVFMTHYLSGVQPGAEFPDYGPDYSVRVCQGRQCHHRGRDLVRRPFHDLPVLL